MKALAVLAAVSCAPLESAPLSEVGPPEFGVVTAKRELEVFSGETRGERAAWALLSLDPIVLATAVLAVEDDFGRSQVQEYDIALVDGGTLTVQSRYLVDVGRCVMMRRPRTDGYVVMVAHEEASCAAETSVASAS